MNHNTIFFYRKSIYISVYKNFKNFLLRDSKPIFVNIHSSISLSMDYTTLNVPKICSTY